MMTAYRWAARLWVLLAVFAVGWATVAVSDERYDRLVLDAAMATQAELVDLPAPDFVLPDLDGNLVSLSSFRGNVVFLNYWATWCPPCREEFPAMLELAEAMRDRPFRMVTISQDEDRAALDAFLSDLGVDPSLVTVLHDPQGEVARAWGTLLLPETYFIDPDGIIAFRYQNSRTWSESSYRQILERMAVRRWKVPGQW
jgi:peroxiredoxin